MSKILLVLQFRCFALMRAAKASTWVRPSKFPAGELSEAVVEDVERDSHWDASAREWRYGRKSPFRVGSRRAEGEHEPRTQMADDRTEADLLARWQKESDLDALELLLQREVSMLASRLRQRGQGMFRPSASASDLAQEAVFRLLRLEKVPEFSEPQELRAYLWKAAWRLLLNRVQMKSRKSVPLSEADTQDLSNALNATGGFSAVDQSEEMAALNLLVRLLKSEDREVLELVYFKHLDINQAAKALGLTRNAIDVRLTRARRRLAEKMASWKRLID